MAVASTLTIRDRASAVLNKVTSAYRKTEAAAQAVDRTARDIDPGRSFDAGTAAIDRARRSMDTFNDRQDRAERGAERVKRAWGGIGTVVKAAVAAFSIQRVKGFMDKALEASDVQIEAETKLNVVMQQRMGTDQNDFQKVLDQAAAQQAAGVVGDEVQMMGAQQLSTFLNSRQALETLIPAMNDLAVQQNGVAVSSESMVNIGNLMGKVMQGQTSALTRVGVTFSAAQEQVLKYGTEAERAATLAQVITDNVGQMNAAMLNTPQGALQQTKNTFGDIMEQVGYRLYPAVVDLFQTLTRNMPTIEQFLMGAAGLLGHIVNGLDRVLGVLSSVVGFVTQNWGVIQPILVGMAAGILAFVTVTTIWNAVTWLQVAANQALMASLLSNPILWVALAIGVVVALIYKWVQSVGGLRVAWLIVCDALLSAWDTVKAGVMSGVYFVIDLWNKLQLGFMAVSANIQNFMGDMRAGVLTILQNMVNGAIGIINGFIETVNKIPGVNIGLIEEVTFGTTAQLENETAKQARGQALADYQAHVEGRMAQRDTALDAMRQESAASTAQRKLEIANARLEAAEKDKAAGMNPWMQFSEGGAGLDSVDEVGEVGRVKDDVNVAEEDIKFLRDVAEMRFVQNFVTLTPTVAMNAQISERVDVDEVVHKIERKMEEEFAAEAEGVFT